MFEALLESISRKMGRTSVSGVNSNAPRTPFRVGTHLQVDVGNVLIIVRAALLQTLEHFVQEDFEIFERVLFVRIATDGDTCIAAHFHRRFVIVVDRTLHQQRLVRLARPDLQALQLEQVLEDFVLHVVPEARERSLQSRTHSLLRRQTCECCAAATARRSTC